MCDGEMMDRETEIKYTAAAFNCSLESAKKFHEDLDFYNSGFRDGWRAAMQAQKSQSPWWHKLGALFS